MSGVGMIQPGQRIGEYEVVQKIGMGGMAEIFKAYDHTMERFVAIKVLLDFYMSDEEFRNRFFLEARSIAQLEHANILPIYDYGEVDSSLYFVVRYMPSGSLAHLVKRESPVSLHTAAHVMTALANALDYAHSKGILHRDLKTENVLLDANDHIYLADFGLAKIIGNPAGHFTRNFLPGTPEFMSPEQCLGEDDLTPASDQYSLGIVLFHMVTGKLPFQTSNPLALLQMQVNQPPPSIRFMRPDLPEAAESIIYRALAKQPGERFPTSGEFAEAFESALGIDRLIDRFGHSDLGERIDAALERVQRRKHRTDKADQSEN
jgi:eukaryotic-like serine/threonine-protein kinase